MSKGAGAESPQGKRFETTPVVPAKKRKQTSLGLFKLHDRGKTDNFKQTVPGRSLERAPRECWFCEKTVPRPHNARPVTVFRRAFQFLPLESLAQTVLKTFLLV